VVQYKILIVADDQEVRELLTDSLSYDDFQIFTASNGSGALYQLGLLLPNLIVLDMSLPDLDGWETLHRLRELSNVPVIVIAAVEEEEQVKSLYRGADYSMSKPLSIREFSARVHALLRRAEYKERCRANPQSAGTPNQ
jgi:DNA-binding response OmpR family regulator